MQLSIDLLVRMKRDPFLTTLNRFVDIQTLDHEFIGGDIWFSLYDLEDKLQVPLLGRNYDIVIRLFGPIFKESIKGTQHCVARTNSGKILISQKALQDLLFLMGGDFPRRFRKEFSKYFHNEDNPNDVLVNLPDMLLKNFKCRREFTKAITILDKLGNQ